MDQNWHNILLRELGRWVEREREYFVVELVQLFNVAFLDLLHFSTFQEFILKK